jgi:phosphatidylserine/phosphatidylglycerophosphate/cardiolipin synthase-like enzyme
MSAWLAAALSGPLLLLGALPVANRPGDDQVAPPAVRHAFHDLDLPAESPGSATFNDPFGSEAEQYALVRHIDAEIDGADRGATIRLAAYSFAMPSTAQALLRAHRRGVGVRVVVDDRSTTWKSVRNLVAELGTDPVRRSFVRVCRSSCRGTAGNQHAKFVTISRTGRATDVVMVGSMNFTAYAAARQWQDLYTVAEDADLYSQVVRLFARMSRDEPQDTLELRTAGEGLVVDVAPRAPDARDPVVGRLRSVECRGATGGTGSDGRTVVRISMHAWNGERGIGLARQVAALAGQGCNVRVLAGVGFGRQVTRILEDGGVGYRASDRDGVHTHEKLMFVSGHVGGRTDAGYVWTGSHNWSDRSLRNDEVTLRVAGQRAVTAYQQNFKRIWDVAGGGRPGHAG